MICKLVDRTLSLCIYVGVDELHVDSQLFGSFTLKANLYRDSAEDICQKVSDVTKVSTAYMQLYARYKKPWGFYNMVLVMQPPTLLTYVKKIAPYCIVGNFTEYKNITCQLTIAVSRNVV